MQRLDENLPKNSLNEATAVYSAEAQTGIRVVVNDLLDGFRRQAVWRTFAWDEIQQRYRRSMLGIAWIAVSYLVFVGAITIFFRGFASMDTIDFVAYSGFGFAAFTFLVGNLTDGCAVFRSASSWIKSASLPYSVYIYQSLARSVFTFAIQLAAGTVLLVTLFGWRPSIESLMSVVALGVFLLNAVWVQYLLGLFGARFGDVQHIVGTIQRLLFFTTPILWVYDERSEKLKRVADINPLTHFIEIFRAPLLGELPNIHSVFYVAAFTFAGWVITLLAAGRMRRRLPFWI